MHAQPVARLAGDEDRRVARQPRQPLAGVGVLARPRAHSSGCSRSRIEIRVRNATSAGSRLASSRLTNRSCSAPACADSTETSACGSPPAAITDSASCRPSGQPSASSCRRAAASRSTRAPKRAAHQLDRLVEPEAQLRSGRRRVHCAVGDQVVDLELAVGARRDHGAQVGRRVAQQVGQRVARRRRQPVGLVDDQDDVERRSARPRRARPSRLRGRSAAPPRAGCGRRSGRPAAGAHRERQALHEARGRRRCGCADSQATTAPCARCSRRHCASSEVLPKPAGACTRIDRPVAQALVRRPAGAAARPGGAARAAA